MGVHLEVADELVVCMAQLEGDPVPWSRAGHGRLGQSYTPRRYGAHRDALAHALAAGRRLRHPLTVELGVWLTFYVRGRRHGDIDNLSKAVLDAGNEIVWADDRLVTFELARILIDPDLPRTEVVVFRREALPPEPEAAVT